MAGDVTRASDAMHEESGRAEGWRVLSVCTNNCPAAWDN